MPDETRLQRIEESQAFLERTIEQLSAEIAEMNRRAADMQARIRALEGRVQRLAQPHEPPEEA